MKNLNNVYDVLKQEKQFLDNEGNIFKNKVCEYARKMDKSLLKLLYNNKLTRDLFFIEIDDLKVFDNQKFNNYIENKDFLPDSYTNFKNNIGLYDNLGNSINDCEDVVLQFPYKDCILEFDSTKESDKRNEIFFNETLMKKEIDVLLNPKVLTNAKRYDKNEISDINEIKDNDNLIIKGNNLLALHSLLPRYKGMIKCMYWDILYNTNNDKVPYNDSFKHSSWLTMMKNRLEVVRDLLSKDGLIFLQCDDNEQAYLTVLCDEVFGRENRVNTICVNMSNVSGKKIKHAIEGKRFPKTKEYILVYKSDKGDIKLKIPKASKTKWDKEYNKIIPQWTIEDNKILESNDIHLANKKIRDYKLVSLVEYCKNNNIELTDEWKLENSYRIFATKPNESLLKKYRNNKFSTDIAFVYNESQKLKLILTNFNKETETARIELASALLNNSIYLSDNWTDISTTGGIAAEGDIKLKNGKKPEKLIQRVIESSTNPGDIVLDAYLGSGTTAAVAHKMNRQYIGIEQLDSHIDKSLQRMKNVINGDQTGISKDVNWQGGGSFVYCELKKLSQLFIDKVNKASEEELLSIYEELKDNQFVSYRVDINKVEKNKKGFLSLSEDKKRKLLIDVIDKNMLYVNYCDIEDEAYNVSQNDKLFNNSFYK